jgi:hypothetical protein
VRAYDYRSAVATCVAWPGGPILRRSRARCKRDRVLGRGGGFFRGKRKGEFTLEMVEKRLQRDRLQRRNTDGSVAAT